MRCNILVWRSAVSHTWEWAVIWLTGAQCFLIIKVLDLHNHVVSGDDDLLVNTLANSKNTRVEYSPETHTRSIPCTEFSEWMLQKKRHLTTAPYYKFRDKLLLITEPLSRVIFYASFIVLLSWVFLWPWVLVVFSIRLIVQITVFLLVQTKLNETGMLGYLLFFDIFSPLINIIIFFSNTRNKSGMNQWK